MTESTLTKPVTVRCVFCQTLNRVDLARRDAAPRCGECHKPILLDRPLPVTGEDFDRTVQSAAVPVLVDFYADWCGPCHAMAPGLDAIAGQGAGELLVLKLDIDRAQEVAARFGVRSIPTLILFDGGREQRRQVGMVDAKRLRAFVGLE